MPAKTATGDRSKTAPISLYLSVNHYDGLKRLVDIRRANGGTGNRPTFIRTILDEAVGILIARVKSKTPVAFELLLASGNRQTSLRISESTHRAAIAAALRANVKTSDFYRTAISLYLRDQAGADVLRKTGQNR